jgi:hypothetical protein
MKSNRIALIAGVVVIAAVVGFLAMRNNWPPSNGTEGAIGSANRYTAQQMSDQDVVLKEPQVQAFLQSDTFHQLATNADFRKAVVENESFVEAARSPRAIELLAQAMDAGGGGADNKNAPVWVPEYATTILSDVNLAKFTPRQLEALFSVENASLMKEPQFLEMIRRPAFVEAARSGNQVEALKNLMVSDNARKVVGELAQKNPEYLAMLSSEALRSFTENADCKTLMGQLSRMQDSRWAMALADNNARNLFADPVFRQLENFKPFTEALIGHRAEMKRLFESNADWAVLCKQAEQ